MSDRQVFHIRRDLLFFLLAALTAGGGTFVYYHSLPCRYVDHPSRAAAAAMAALSVVGVDLVVLVLGLRVVSVEAGGLRFGAARRGGEAPPTVPWSRVRDVTFPRSGFFGPHLILRLDPPLPRGRWVRERNTVRLGAYWADRERLFAQVLAHVPHAGRSETLAAYLAAPHRLARRYKVGAVLAMAFSMVVFGVGLYEALTCGITGFATVLLLGAAIVPCPFFAAAVSREWVWKPLLVVVEMMLLALAVHAVITAAWVFGTNGPLVVLLAAGLAWGAVTTGVCLVRRPSGRLVAAAYLGAIVAAVVPSWYHGVREPVASTEGRVMAIGLGALHWSADGRSVWAVSRGLGGEKGALHLLEIASGRARRVEADGNSSPLRHARDYDFLSLRRRSAADGSPAHELVALNTATGQSACLHQAPLIRMAVGSSESPDGLMEVFLAGRDDRLRLYTLRVTDLSVGEVYTDERFSASTLARWRPDGTLVLAELQEAGPLAAGGPHTLTLWAFAPGVEPPARLYSAQSRSISVDYSPDLRWALVGLDREPFREDRWDHLGPLRMIAEYGTDWDTVDRCELVDLLTGHSRPVEPPLPLRSVPLGYRVAAWSPDGSRFAYTAKEGDHCTLVCVDPLTGRASRPYRTRGGRMTRVALSCDAKYAACLVRRGIASRLVIVELATGRAAPIRRVLMFPFFHQIAWSPVEATLAVAFPKDTRPHCPRLVRFYQLE